MLKYAVQTIKSRNVQRTGVGGCGSQSGSNRAMGPWLVGEGENTGGRVRQGFEKLFLGFLMAKVKRWNLGITQSENVWHTSCDWKDGTESTALYSFQTLTLGVGETSVECVAFLVNI